MIEKSNFPPKNIEVRGASINNLKNIDIDIPLHKFVAITGPSGAGKSSLAMGILYAEGSRRYLEALSTYTRRRISQAKETGVREVRHIPSAIALRQRPTVPSERSTVGSMSEILSVIRLIFSRLASPVCPNGHKIAPSLAIAKAMDAPGDKMGEITCPTCQVEFMAKSAEDFAYNSGGACPKCHGTGKVQTLDPTKIIPDDNKTINEGAVASWRLPGRNFMNTIAATLGVRLDVPFKDLTNKEKDIVLHGEKKKYAVDFHTSTGRVYSTDGTLYENAYEAVYASLKTAKTERSLTRINKFFKFSTCPLCHGNRLNPELLKQTVAGMNIAEVSNLTLAELVHFECKTINWLPEEMKGIAKAIFKDLEDNLTPLLDLGLDYLTLARNGNTLSTGELQRIQLARTLRTETTGVLYVLDEPTIGLHPDNVSGLLKIFRKLIDQGNSLVVVDHEVSVIEAADWVIEIGPEAGEMGGRIVAEGRPEDLENNPKSMIGKYLSGTAKITSLKKQDISLAQSTQLRVKDYFNLHDVEVAIPDEKLTAVTGFSGAGKTSLILDSLVPAIKNPHALPAQVTKLTTSIKSVISVDAKPVGKNTRSCVATYTSIMDNLRHLFANLLEAKEQKLKISAFSYNNKQGACPTCQGLGKISLDLQYLPDMEQVCPTCQGQRFAPDILKIKWHNYSIAELLNLSVNEAIPVFSHESKILRELTLLQEVGLGYLHLGESTPELSGGEAQRLKLIKHLQKSCKHTLFVFDEPTIGLHPSDIQVLLKVLRRLQKKGATIAIITHDLDIMTNCDYLIDLGPKGGSNGGQVMATGNPFALVKSNNSSLTLQYLRQHLLKYHLV